MYYTIGASGSFLHRVYQLSNTCCIVALAADIDDLFDVKTELMPVAARWKDLGLALRLNPYKLDEIEADNKKVGDSLTEVLKLWLNKSYNAKKFGEPSWHRLAEAVGHASGGNNPALAEKLHTK